jgi:phage terminase large subunit-like protein
MNRLHDVASELDTYATDVVEGRIPAGRYHRLACERHLKDRARENTPEFPYRFDNRHARRFFRFAERLKHYKGKQFAGKPIELSPNQRFRLGSVFGWRHVGTGMRRFTTAYNELPRKTGKSLEAAIVALYVTFMEGEAGAEGYCIATKRKQAEVVLSDAIRLAKASGMADRLQLNKRSIVHDATASSLQALGGDASTQDGLNPYFVCVDEMHAMRSRDLLDVMESATGARLSFLFYQITTAGDDPVSVCGDQHDYACRILDGTLDEDDSTVSFFAFIAHADIDDDPWDERTWYKANPHLGISVSIEELRKIAAKAKKMPGAAAEFKQKRLNLWVNSYEPWLSMEGWNKGQTDVDREQFLEELAGAPCYIGIDLSSKIDLCAVVALFPPFDGRGWRIDLSAFTPEDTVDARQHRDRAPYAVWIHLGWLEKTPGNRIDYDAILERVKELAQYYDVRAIGVDPWNAGNLITDLQNEGFEVVEVPQTFAHLSGACKDFEGEVLDGIVDANANPLMRWAVGNAVVQRDGKDNIQPIKKKSRGRIDPVVATAIARRLAGAVEPPPTSAYSGGGSLMVVG